MILKEAMSNGLAVIDGVKCLEFASSGEEVDNLIFFDIWEIVNAKLIKAVLDSMVESADIESTSRVYLRNGTAGKGALHIK